MKKKKIVNNLIEIVFTVALTMLGRFDLQSMHLGNYQIIVSLFWVTGIMKYMCSENELKEDILDVSKDLFISIIIIPIWFMMSGNIESDIYEPISIIVHFGVLVLILYITSESVKMCGKIAYYTSMVIPMIAIVLIRIGAPVTVAVVIAVVVSNLINLCIKKKDIHQ